MGRWPNQAWTHAARMLRRRSTEAERAAWRLLRNRGVLGLKFRRQHRIGRVIVDFYCAELRLVIELDGGYHQSGEQQARDGTRTKFLQAGGVRVVRVANADVSKAKLTTLLQPYVPLAERRRRSGSGPHA